MPKYLSTYDGLGDGMATVLAIEDAANAYLCALQTSIAGCRAYHFTADDVTGRLPIRDRIAGKWPHLSLPPDWPKFRSVVDCGRAKTELGWRPRRAVQDWYDQFGIARSA
jgi:nucleoside-diphosphate-sugar epimerase